MKRLQFFRFVAPLLVLAACDSGPKVPVPMLTVLAAGSLARPLRAALDTIAATGGPTVQMEVMGSREMLRAMTMLGRTPDLLVTADADELEQILIPSYVSSSTTFARNRVVLALSAKSAKAAGVTTENWMELVGGGTLRIARTDPKRAPLGYRTQLVWRLAEIESQRAGLAAKLAASSPDALMRGNEADLATLLESGDVDAAWCYESLAKSMNLKFVRVGDRIDLGSEAELASYRRALIRTAGATTEDTVMIAGSPIRYSIALVSNSADAVGSALLRDRLLDSVSKRVMRRVGLDVSDSVRVVTASSNDRQMP